VLHRSRGAGPIGFASSVLQSMCGLKRVKQELANTAGSKAAPDRMPGNAGKALSQMITEDELSK